MHEFAIATSIQEIVHQNIDHIEGELQVKSVRVKHGLLSQVVPDILVDAFNAIVKSDPALTGTQLELELVMPILECNACKQTFGIDTKEAVFMPCPHCSSCASHKLIEGKELIVDHIEAVEI